MSCLAMNTTPARPSPQTAQSRVKHTNGKKSLFMFEWIIAFSHCRMFMLWLKVYSYTLLFHF